MNVGIINYGIGNISSVVGAIKNLGYEYHVIERVRDFDQIDKLILPGIGNFKKCMETLNLIGFTKKIKEKVSNDKIPILGICLGMQLLASWGAEGNDATLSNGLDLIEGKIINLKELGTNKKLPHVGWNSISIKNDSNFLKDIPNNTDFYFVHSFAYHSINDEYVIAEANYGINFPAVITKEHIWATQFHPEKSSKWGLKIIKNFLEN